MKVFKENINKHNTETIRLTKLMSRISWLRLLLFIFSTGLLITLFGFNLNTAGFIVLFTSIVCFGIVIKHHNKAAYLKKHTTFLKKINESELEKGECSLEGFDTGERFIDQGHSYTSDLDIFGQHSIFQLVNRTTTESGMIRLSEWLSEPAPNKEIHDRQDAIKELSEKLEWRQDFEASGMHFKNNRSDYYKLLDWVEAPFILLKHRRIYTAVAIILSILSLLSFYFILINLGSANEYVYYLLFLIIILFVNYLVLKRVKAAAENIVETSTKNLSTLRGYQALINKIESESFKSTKLYELQLLLINSKYSANVEINRICTLLDFSHQRPVEKVPIGGNYLYPLFNSFLLLDIYLIIGVEKWKSMNKVSLKSWTKIVSEFEVINSFAGFSYSNPSYAFPEVSEKNNYVHYKQLGHPLINSDERVCNDFYSEGSGDVVMVTGSNMGGKSTFLRTVGVNLVLALAGAPCCAKYGQVANLKVFTSMRTQDNLMKGTSSFYAELNRIEKMLKLMESGQNIYFLLDEMFKGTNSEDRHRGGFSLINQLGRLNSSGIIATHDIELANLAGSKKLVSNYSFNSEIKDNTMIFSYEIEPGICYDFNASELMKRSGINIISDN